MCIRDSHLGVPLDAREEGQRGHGGHGVDGALPAERVVGHCLLYTSDAADDLLCVDLGGRRIIKKKKAMNTRKITSYTQ